MKKKKKKSFKFQASTFDVTKTTNFIYPTICFVSVWFSATKVTLYWISVQVTATTSHLLQKAHTWLSMYDEKCTHERERQSSEWTWYLRDYYVLYWVLNGEQCKYFDWSESEIKWEGILRVVGVKCVFNCCVESKKYILFYQIFVLYQRPWSC